jgi:hypothetical protein
MEEGAAMSYSLANLPIINALIGRGLATISNVDQTEQAPEWVKGDNMSEPNVPMQMGNVVNLGEPSDSLSGIDFNIAMLESEFIGKKDGQSPVWHHLKAIEKAYAELEGELAAVKAERDGAIAEWKACHRILDRAQAARADLFPDDIDNSWFGAIDRLAQAVHDGRKWSGLWKHTAKKWFRAYSEDA